MIKWANFFPGDLREERSLTIDDHAAYEGCDLRGFIIRMMNGCAASMLVAMEDNLPSDDDLVSLVAALEDGALMADWFECQDSEDETPDQRARREAVEEVYNLLTSYDEQRGMTITMSTSRDYLGSWADESDYADFEVKGAAILKRAWPYATHRIAAQHRLVTVDHDRLQVKDRVEAEASQLLEHVW